MIVTRRIRCQTQGNNHVLDLTGRLAQEVAASGVRHGLVVAFVTGSTAGLTTIEDEPGLVADLKDLLDRLVPREAPYRHNRTEGDQNGHSHLRAALIGPSLVVPVEGGRMTLGAWQQVVLVDCDVRPRAREVVVQVMGEE
ncbi:MAG: YjbQ family protein [Chloroflexi bacterium]|nr:YjbQ family protein [Chloroflexota bacterium]